MVERVLALVGAPVELVLNTAPVGGVLPDLVRIAGGDPKRVLTISDLAASAPLGVRNSFSEGMGLRYDKLGEYVQRAAEGKFTVPVAQTFALDDWRAALDLSLRGHAHGKVVLLTGA